MKSKEEIWQLANDIIENKVWTSEFHCKSREDVGMTFPILSLIHPDQVKQMIDIDPAMVYQYIEKAGPRSINGMPMFLSCEYLGNEDFQTLKTLLKKISEGKEKLKQELLELNH